MNSESVYIGIALLFAVSIVVRIIPSIVTLNLQQTAKEKIRSILPTAVFINLVVYCAFQEIEKTLLPSIVGIGVMLIVFRKAGLILSVITGTSIYLILETFARKPFHLHAALKTYSIGHL